MSKEMQLSLTGTYIPPSPGSAAQTLSTRDRAEREQRERFLQKLIDYARRRMDPASDAFTGERGFPSATMPTASIGRPSSRRSTRFRSFGHTSAMKTRPPNLPYATPWRASISPAAASPSPAAPRSQAASPLVRSPAAWLTTKSSAPPTRRLTSNMAMLNVRNDSTS